MKTQKKKNKLASVSQSVPRESNAVDFELNPFYERLLEMKRERPDAFNNLSAATRLTMQAYIKAKQALAETNVRKTAA